MSLPKSVIDEAVKCLSDGCCDHERHKAVAVEALLQRKRLIKVDTFLDWTFGIDLGPLWKLLEPVLPLTASGKNIVIYAEVVDKK